MGKQEPLNSLDEVADKLGDRGPHNPDVTYETVEDLVDALVDLGDTPKVYARHDDHHGLKSELTTEFLETKLIDVDPEAEEENIRLVLEQANTIIPLSEQAMTPDLEDEIREDQQSRGIRPAD